MTNNKQKNRNSKIHPDRKPNKVSPWKAERLSIGICDLFVFWCLEFVIYLKFAFPPSFWRGAWNL
jgi:hypothetical protein